MPLDVLTYGNAMSACSRGGQTQTVLRLLSSMRRAGLQPNAFCYNAAIGACARTTRLRQGISIMDEMEAESARLGDPMIAPTVHTYSALLKACAQEGEWRAAKQLLQRMLRQGLAPSAFHYGCVIAACGRQPHRGY